MFHLFGFPVRIRPGFVVFLGLFIFLYQNATGYYLAAGLAGFTLLHELGHALAARSAGADAEISLDFMAGYTSFSPDPKRPLGLIRRAVISAAGPAIQIAAGVAVLLAMGVNPIDEASVRQSAAAVAVWWTGPVIGVLNLIPVLPLDGGHLALVGVESITRRESFRIMVIISLVLTGGAAAYLLLSGQTSFAIFIAFLLFSQMQMLSATNPKSQQAANPRQQLLAAEQQAWQTGEPGPIDIGQQISPWFHAHQLIGRGQPQRAAQAVLDDLRRPQVTWLAPAGASIEQLAEVVDVLPSDLPNGNPHSQQILTDVLLGLGRYDVAGRYAVAGFEAHGTPIAAMSIARAAAATGDASNALAWIEAAIDRAQRGGPPAERALAAVIDSAIEFRLLRGQPEFVQLRSQLE